MSDFPEPPGSRAGLVAALADRYTIERELGRGGNATVYLAHDLKHHRKVALKVLLPELAQSVRTERFLREIQIAAQLTHPHILPIHDSGDVNGFLYYVMPYVAGESLRARLTREKQLSLDDAVQITREVADALAYAHKQGVVHRDIKPENILLHEGHALVADFGIARALTAAGGQTVTETGIAVGTPAYMSPEQAAGSGEPDARSDLYSLACVLYEMLVGRPPFTGTTAQEILARHALDPVPSLRAARPDVPEAVERAVAKALAKVPVARFATVAEFAAALTIPSERPRRLALGRRALYVGVGLLALLAAGAVGARSFFMRGPARAGQPSIAVLPFINLTGDSANEYLSDGITEELINALVQLPALRVPARTSSFFFKGKAVSLRQIGESLKVANVLEGSLRKAGNRLRVTAQLIQVADGYHLWSASYNRELAGIEGLLDVEEEIARASVGALQVRLSGQAGTPLLPRYTASSAAHELYLKGRYLSQRGTERELNQAREFFSAAIASDSGYARAYAGLADVYIGLWGLVYVSRAEASAKARAAADRAVTLDPLLAEAYASRGQVRQWEWDWAGAVEDYRRAIALDPDYAAGHARYGHLLVFQGRFAEGVKEGRRAVELDPLSPGAQGSYCDNLVWARQYDRAVEQCRTALALGPNRPGVHQRLATAYLFQHKFADAIQEFQTALDLLGGRGRVFSNLAQLGYAYASAGRRQEALQIVDDLKAQPDLADSATTGYMWAVLYAGLGEKDRAFEWLERAYQGHSHLLYRMRVDPFFDPLRRDRRFDELVKKIGL